jgi:hypothetical protein
MKIVKIESKDGIFYVTKKPNLLEKIFGKKEKVERYKTNNDVFLYFNDVTVFYKEDGSIVSINDKMCDVLNNHLHSF